MAQDIREQVQASLGDTHAIERELGGGGMSRTFVSLERALSRRVVIKVLSPELSAGVSVERFKREIMLAAQLQHPHIVPVLASGDADGLPWFTMPYVEGDVLSEITVVLGCYVQGFPQTYLGLPLSCNKLRLEDFEPIITKIDKYLAGWCATLLSLSGCFVLIDAVLSTVPV
jgi:hypothetical protein